MNINTPPTIKMAIMKKEENNNYWKVSYIVYESKVVQPLWKSVSFYYYDTAIPFVGIQGTYQNAYIFTQRHTVEYL